MKILSESVLMSRFYTIVLLLITAILPLAAEHQIDTDTQEASLPKVSLITVGPGSNIYELEGHTALRFVYDDGRDISVHWGVFDFNAPNFVYRFVKGETDYSIGMAHTSTMLRQYEREGRSVTEQPLGLNDIETAELLRLIDINLRPENQVYRYNYVHDNCATRPLALLERALAADSASLVIKMPDEATTFRKEMRRYHANFPTYQFGIDLALGNGIDRPITSHDRAFAPVYLSDLANYSLICDRKGKIRHFTKGLTVLAEGPGEPYKQQSPSPWFYVMIVLFAAIIMARIDQRKMAVSKWFDALFFLIYGLAGCIIAFLVFVSEHEATSPNFNLLWLNPLALIVPILIWFRKATTFLCWYMLLNVALDLVYFICILCGAQAINYAFVPLIFAEMILALNFVAINHNNENGRLRINLRNLFKYKKCETATIAEAIPEKNSGEEETAASEKDNLKQ